MPWVRQSSDFNLPFDISRLAIGHSPSRGRIMKGGFSFQLLQSRNWPNVQIKHLSSRVSLIRFPTQPGFVAGRGMRKRKIKPTPRPGYFVDVRTLAAALTSRSFDLAGLADFLGTEHRKLKTQDHGKVHYRRLPLLRQARRAGNLGMLLQTSRQICRAQFQNDFSPPNLQRSEYWQSLFQGNEHSAVPGGAAGFSGLSNRHHHERLFRRPR